MKARFLTWEQGEIGTVEDVGGVAVPSNEKVARLIERVRVGDDEFTPDDGKYLIAMLPFAYAGTRLRAEIVDAA
jgi:hypothetical protein